MSVRVAPVAVLLLVLVACNWNPATERSLPTPLGHGPVVQVAITPYPEGPFSPIFAATGADGRHLRSLAKIKRFVPASLPAPLLQETCEVGGILTVTFADGSKIAYGPCRRPPEIDRLWAGVIFVLSKGECAPKCGPGGTAGP